MSNKDKEIIHLKARVEALESELAEANERAEAIECLADRWERIAFIKGQIIDNVKELSND